MQIKFFATYRDITKCKKTELPAPDTVLELLRRLAERYGSGMRDKVLAPEGNDVGADAIILVNGRHIAHLQGVWTPLCEADVVAVFPLVAGG